MKILDKLLSFNSLRIFAFFAILHTFLNAIFYQVIFKYLNPSWVYDSEYQVLVISSDARHYIKTLREYADVNWHEFMAYFTIEGADTFVYNMLLKVMAVFFSSTWAISLINAISILGLSIYLLTKILSHFHLSRKYINIIILLLMCLPTQYAWLLQPLKDGWIVVACLIVSYLPLLILKKRINIKLILEVFLWVSVLSLIIGIARRQLHVILWGMFIVSYIFNYIYFNMNKELSEKLKRNVIFILTAAFFSIASFKSAMDKEKVYVVSINNPPIITTTGGTTDKPGEVKFYMKPFITLIGIRNMYIKRYSDANTYVDPVIFENVDDAILYLPKSTLIGMFTPLSFFGSVRSSNMWLQMVSLLEIIIIWLTFIFALFISFYKLKSSKFLLAGALINFAMVITTVSFAMPIAGVIVRQRFPFALILVMLSLVVIASYKKRKMA